MRSFLVLGVFIALFGCGSKKSVDKETDKSKQIVVQKFLDEYTKEYQNLYYVSSEAAWKANTYIKEGDTATSYAVQKADQAYAAFVGSEKNIKMAQEALENKDALTEVQIRQLETILYNAANNPGVAPELVAERIKADNEQNNKLYGFDFKINDESITTNEIDNILKTENNVEKRLAAWESSKEVGKGLKQGLENLRNLRNQTVSSLGYSDYYSYQVSDYDMTADEMLELNRKINRELRPLFRELHTYARYSLAEKYGQEVPDMLPAHWLPNRWGQDWSSMVDVEGIDLNSILAAKGDEWLIKQAEKFYVSLGFPELPASFYEKSSLYPLPEGSDYKKNNHASAWHMDLEKDVRSLMSVEPNTEWYETTHHELGHIYYYLTYTNEDTPPLLRGGANRAYHEAMGSLMGLAAMQKPFIQGLGLIGDDVETDEMQTLLKEALNYVVFIPFATGVMTEFEHDLYKKKLSIDEFNKRWWEIKYQYQGIVPPTERGEEFCDAASKTHINDDAAQYYDYALSYVILFQFHDYISKNILKQDPRATNYFGNKEVGKYLQEIMYPGANVDWREHLKKMTGEELSARAMVEYFQPLTDWLKKENEGRNYTLEEL